MQLKNQNSGSKTICGFSVTLILKELWRFKVKKSMLYVKQKINFNKTRRNRKWKISHILSKRRTLCISSCKNHILKTKLWVGAHKRKKNAFILSGGNFFNICFVLMYSETFRIFLKNFKYQKNFTSYTFCLFSRSLKAFKVKVSHK